MDFVFYLSIACFILIFGSIHNGIDYDFWARLVVGKTFFSQGHLLNHDFVSYGTTHEFIDHEWGSSLIFYFIQNNFGDIGLYIFKSLIIFLTIFLIVKIIRLEKKDTKLYFLFFFFALQSVSYNIFSTVRCQTFSFLFFVLYLYILKKSKTNYKLLFLIPLINIIWANCHGGFAIGLTLVLIYALGEMLNKNNAKPYFITFLLASLTTLINPYGIKYIYFIFSALALDRIHITEWQSSFFHPLFKFYQIKFKIFFAITFLIFIYSIIKNIKLSGFKNYYQKIDKTKYLLIIFCAIIALKSMRFHVFFAYSVLALCYNNFYEIFNKKLPLKIDNLKEIILSALMFISTISHIYNYKFINTVKDIDYPIYCIEFLKINNLKGNLLTNFHFGSYASYKLYPNIKIFMDGRYEEVYDVNLINEMGDLFLVDNDNLLKKYKTDFIIIEKFYPLYKKLKSDDRYFSVFESKKFALFLSKEYKNHKFITPVMDNDYYNREKFKTNIN